jgi:hypothetical protein
MERNATAFSILRTFSVCFFSLSVGAAILAALSAFVASIPLLSAFRNRFRPIKTCLKFQ